VLIAISLPPPRPGRPPAGRGGLVGGITQQKKHQF